MVSTLFATSQLDIAVDDWEDVPADDVLSLDILMLLISLNHYSTNVKLINLNIEARSHRCPEAYTVMY